MKEKLGKRVSKRWRMIIATMVIVALAVVVDYWIQDYIYKTQYEIVEDDFSHVFQIDSIEQKNNKLVLTGWVFELEKDSVEDDYEVILYDYNNYKEYYLKTKDVVREDVNEYFLCEYDYSNSGFRSETSVKKLELEHNNYEILFRFSNGRKAFKTGIYISDGEIVYTCPEDFVELDVEGTGLETIIDDGVLRVYRPDVGIYVYQYDGSLYYIVDETYKFEENEDVFIQQRLYTTQIEKLPESIIESGLKRDNDSFYFNSKEIGKLNVDNYRVSAKEFFYNYSVFKMFIAEYRDVGGWQQYFRPWYEFGK